MNTVDYHLTPFSMWGTNKTNPHYDFDAVVDAMGVGMAVLPAATGDEEHRFEVPSFRLALLMKLKGDDEARRFECVFDKEDAVDVRNDVYVFFGGRLGEAGATVSCRPVLEIYVRYENALPMVRTISIEFPLENVNDDPDLFDVGYELVKISLSERETSFFRMRKSNEDAIEEDRVIDAFRIEVKEVEPL